MKALPNLKNSVAHKVLLALGGSVLLAPIGCAPSPKYLGPSAIVASPDGSRLYVACTDAKRIISVDSATGHPAGSAPLPAEPSALALSPDGKTLYAACGASDGVVCALDPTSLSITARFAVANTPSGIAPHPDGKRLYVCNRFENNISVIDIAAGKETARIAVIREPVGAVATPDGKSVFVINHLPLARADGDVVAAAVTVIDTASGGTSHIPLPNGSTGLRGICLTPDGKHALVTHILARFHLPTTQLERGWQNTNALSIIDTASRKLVNTILLDDVDLGAAIPWGVACSADGKWACVTHFGTHEMSIIDLPGVFAKLAQIPAEAPQSGASGYGASGGRYLPASQTEVPNDLAFLVDLRRRIPLDGKGSRGVAVAGAKAFAAQYFSDRLAVVDLAPDARPGSTPLPLGPEPKWTKARRGEVIFADATICFQHWQGCASCHPDARADGLNWDLLNDGIGNPKNNKSMLFTHRTPPAMFSGIRESAEKAVRSGFRNILFAVVEEDQAAAVDEYLKSLRPVPNPYHIMGELTPSAEHGKDLFFDKAVGCSACHPTPLYTDLKEHDVASKSPRDPETKFDTPTLVECWRTAPYLHDGRYTTLLDLLREGKHGFPADKPMPLTESDLNDLVEFVLSL